MIRGKGTVHDNVNDRVTKENSKELFESNSYKCIPQSE